MNETIVIALMLLLIATLFVVAIVKWFKEYKHDDCINSEDYLLDDFYTFGKCIKDEDIW